MTRPVLRRVRLLLLPAVLCAVSAAAQDDIEPDPEASAAPAPVDTTASGPFAALDAMSCDALRDVLHVDVPRAVYDDQPDRVYELIIYLDDRCDLGEPLGRMQILASIWDGNFDEIIYGYEVVDWLARRWDPGRTPPSGSEAALYDAFTVDLADQLLPHQAVGSLEEFFCLFYSGRRDEAWARLQDGSLDDTWLQYYYNEEIEILRHQDAPYLITAYWGGWSPHGDIAFVDLKHLVGASIEQWTTWGFLRLAIEGRVGRTGRPYFVDQDGVEGFSDRWDALLVALEGGTAVWRRGPHLADVFLGVGYDVVKPFKNEDVSPAGLNLSLGGGWRTHLDHGRRWYVRLDARFEWLSDRNAGGTPLGGHAFSARLGLGFRLGRNPEPRLEALGQGGN